MSRPPIWTEEEERLLDRLIAEIDTEAAQLVPVPPRNMDQLNLQDYTPPPRSLWQDIWTLQGLDEEEEELSSEEEAQEEEEHEQPIAGPSHAPTFSNSNSISTLVSLLETTYPDPATRQSITSSLVDVLTHVLSSDAHAKDAAAEELAELLGFEHLDLVADLLQNPSEAVHAVLGTTAEPDRPVAAAQQPEYNFVEDARYDQGARFDDEAAAAAGSVRKGPQAALHRYTPTSSFTLRSTSEIQAAKASRHAQRREQRAGRSGAGAGGAPLGMHESEDGVITDAALAARSEALRQQAAQNAHPLFATGDGRPIGGEAAVYPHVFSSSNGGSTLSVFGNKFALPSGTTRDEKTFYEEITIPPPRTVPMRINERLVPIGEMDDLCRGAFPGYTSLNRLQSVVYPLGYASNENLLVCAPTGAGKTDVAMLTVLRCISQYASPAMAGRGGFQIARNEFKIVYVAPMKALASEIVRKFSKRLSYLGIVVRELTGDMQLTRKEIAETQMIVTTPEKWDVVTRRPAGEGEIAGKLRLLIIDEVHLLHEDRGAVIETIVARTLRQVESSQNLIRIVGLSATLPNFVDVADFLRVNRYKGLFYFDSSFRPVPLQQHFIGVKGKAGSPASRSNLDKAAFEKVSALLQEGHQVMVFVHARKETVKSALSLKEMCSAEGLLDLLTEGRDEHPRIDFFKRELGNSRNREMKELFDYGFGIHHAGMLRSDRNLSERMFEAGVTKVLCCTATLAWGVNLPAYAVVIKGTDVYDSSAGKFVDLSILDVLQIFGRAGRPQYEDLGVGYICTPLEKLSHYVDSITAQHPIESSFIKGLADSLNAEVALGTVASVTDGVSWLGYTYLQTRMRKQPLMYGMEHQEVLDDPHLGAKRHSLITSAAKQLQSNGMLVWDSASGTITTTPLGRIAARYYIGHTTIEIFNSKLRANMSEADVLSVLTLSTDFQQIIPRDNEDKELKKLLENAPCEVPGGLEAASGKTNVLLQAYISKAYVEDFALVSETAYVAQNSARILRALIEMGLTNKWATFTHSVISMSKAVEKRLWPFDHPLAQSSLSPDTLFNLSRWADDVEVRELAAMDAAELGKLIHLNDRLGGFVKQAAREFPHLAVDYSVRPLLRDTLQVDLAVRADFIWSEKQGTGHEPFYFWIEAPDGVTILQWAMVHIKRGAPPVRLRFNLAVPDEGYESLVIRWVSDRWIGCEDAVDVSLQGMRMADASVLHTELLELPLVTAPKLFDGQLAALNPIQTQSLHTFLHSASNALLCAPTAAGASTVAYTAISHHIAHNNESSRVFVIGARPGLLTRDFAAFKQILPDLATESKLITRAADVEQARIAWMTASTLLELCISSHRTLSQLGLVICDGLHLLDATYDLAVSLARRAAPLARFVGVSASLQDPAALATWLEAHPAAIFSFRPNERPTIVKESVMSFDMPHSRGLTKTMVKPAYDAIRASNSAAIVFVPSRAQCYVTAEDLATASASDLEAEPLLAVSVDELEASLKGLHQMSLTESLVHGIGVYEESMHWKDRKIMVSLLQQGIIKVLVVARTSCWSLDLKVPMVVIVSTQYLHLPSSSWVSSGKGFSLANHQLVDYAPETIVRMQSFACRPADGADNAHVLLLTQASQEAWHRKILHTGLPLESPLLDQGEHVVLRTVVQLIGIRQLTSRQDLLDLFSWTYAAFRLAHNPCYYGALASDVADATAFLSRCLHTLLAHLGRAGLLTSSKGSTLALSPLGQALAVNDRGLSALLELWQNDSDPLQAILASRPLGKIRINPPADTSHLPALRLSTSGDWLRLFGLSRKKPEAESEADQVWTAETYAKLLLARYFAKGFDVAGGDDASSLMHEAQAVVGLLSAQ